MGGGRIASVPAPASAPASASASPPPYGEVSDGDESPPASPARAASASAAALPADATAAAMRLAGQVTHTQHYVNRLCMELTKRIPAYRAPPAAPVRGWAEIVRDAATQHHFVCNVCTFANEPAVATTACSMCTSPRPPQLPKPPTPVAAPPPPVQLASADELKTPGLSAAELDALNETRRMLRLTHDMLSNTMLLHQAPRAAAAAATAAGATPASPPPSYWPAAPSALFPVLDREPGAAAAAPAAAVEAPSAVHDVLTVLFLGVVCPLLLLVLLPSVVAIGVLAWLPSTSHPWLQARYDELACALRRLATPVWVATTRAPARRLARACHLATLVCALVLGVSRWRIVLLAALLQAVLVWLWHPLAACAFASAGTAAAAAAAAVTVRLPRANARRHFAPF